MAKHECTVPAASAKRRWKCPTCKQTWTFRPNAGKLSEVWHGADNTRMADGSKVKSWWSW